MAPQSQDGKHAPLRLMAVLAHPDDESLGVGGVLAKYAVEGVEVYLVTATRGEGGRYHEHRGGPDHPGPERLGEIREAEVRCAAQALGVRGFWLLGYKDGGLDAANPREIVGRIAGRIREVRPQVVLTFPPDGAYGHPDHIAICQFTTAALLAAADPASTTDPAGMPHSVSKLYYMVNSPARWEAYQHAFKRLVTTVDGVERVAHAWPEWEITTTIDTTAHWEIAWKAVSCHESQIAVYERLKDLDAERHRALWGTQEFYRALSTVNGGRAKEHDLFEGLR
ncbi:MAG TPA: PIG-L family deacetylase [Candidatus Eisenbacteria bacterium]|jgi:LmbE family N-acetylglucosaminyl deacetylase|nr:PIG-L family deacetylase [Candidatus Eisenbacteria bacterium]